MLCLSGPQTSLNQFSKDDNRGKDLTVLMFILCLRSSRYCLATCSMLNSTLTKPGSRAFSEKYVLWLYSKTPYPIGIRKIKATPIKNKNKFSILFNVCTSATVIWCCLSRNRYQISVQTCTRLQVFVIHIIIYICYFDMLWHALTWRIILEETNSAGCLLKIKWLMKKIIFCQILLSFFARSMLSNI